MAMSTEYRDITWVGPPASFQVGRSNGPPRVIVIHYTAGARGPGQALNGAHYDQVRTDSVSTHYFVDTTQVVQCVLTKDTAYAALYHGNMIGIQYELCATVQPRAAWLDNICGPMLALAATQSVRDAKKYNIPLVKLTPTQVAAGASGYCGHADITLAFPQDGGDHTDPGTEFPWDVFMGLVSDAVTPTRKPHPFVPALHVEADMPINLIRHAKHPEVFGIWPSGIVRWVGAAEYAAYNTASVPILVSQDDAEYARLLSYDKGLRG